MTTHIIERDALVGELHALLSPEDLALPHSDERLSALLHHDVESSLAGVVALVAAARLDVLVAGFPDYVDLSTGKAVLTGLSARRGPDGVWRLEGSDATFSYVLPMQPPDGLGYPAAGVGLRALRVHSTPETLGRLAELLDLGLSGWAVERFVQSVAPRVPLHTLAASLSHLPGMFAAFGGELTYGDAYSWARAVKAAGAPIDMPVRDGFPPAIITACRTANHALFGGLVSAGASTGVRDGMGRTCLMAASLNADLRMVENLLRIGTTAQWVDKEGSTALHCLAETACQGRCDDAVAVAETLMAHGADPDAVRADGRTPRGIVAAALQDAGTSAHPRILPDTVEALGSLLAVMGSRVPA